jgi:hypothetical protein
MGLFYSCCHTQRYRLAGAKMPQGSRPTREVKAMKDKLSLRPDLAPVVDWCMAWIRGTRQKYVTPSFMDMLTAWQREKDNYPNSTFFNGRVTPGYARDQCAVHWNCYMEHEHVCCALLGARMRAAGRGACKGRCGGGGPGNQRPCRRCCGRGSAGE